MRNYATGKFQFSLCSNTEEEVLSFLVLTWSRAGVTETKDWKLNIN